MIRSDEDVRVIIPSHKRAGLVTTHEVCAGTYVCVPESQAAAYEEFHPASTIITHPDTVIGLPNKRQWIYQTFGDVFMMDDDVDGMFRVYRDPGSKQPTRVPPERVYEVIQMTAFTARKLGAYLFSVSIDFMPYTYNPQRPFKLGGFVQGAALGMLGGKPPTDSRLFFPDMTWAVEDYWISLLNAYYHRYAFIDRRFSIVTKGMFTSMGGQLEFREGGRDREGVLWLRRKFGACIAAKPPAKQKSHGKIVTRQQNDPWAKRMYLPYKV